METEICPPFGSQTLYDLTYLDYLSEVLIGLIASTITAADDDDVIGNTAINQLFVIEKAKIQ